MYRATAWLVALILLAGAGRARAGLIVVEPDDFPNGTALTNAVPGVTLSTALSDNVLVPLFVVTATDDPFGFAPTGTRVFAHVDIPFFNNDRRLRMDFAAPTSSVRIAFAGGTFFTTEVGRLEAYDAADNLLSVYVTAPRGPGEVELMALTRPESDISYAVAYSTGSFGRLDGLAFEAVAVTEPSMLTLLCLGMLGLLGCTRWRRGGRPSC